MSDPFLGIDAFKEEYQEELTSGQVATATRLLVVVSDYIRLRKPDADTAAAQQVVFEVVQDAITFGHYRRLSAFENETSKRRERVVFAATVGVLDELLTDAHKRMLGVPTFPSPSYYFGD